MRKAIKSGWEGYVSDWLDCSITDDLPEGVFSACCPAILFHKGCMAKNARMSMTHHYIGPHA